MQQNSVISQGHWNWRRGSLGQGPGGQALWGGDMRVESRIRRMPQATAISGKVPGGQEQNHTLRNRRAMSIKLKSLGVGHGGGGWAVWSWQGINRQSTKLDQAGRKGLYLIGPIRFQSNSKLFQGEGPVGRREKTHVNGGEILTS